MDDWPIECSGPPILKTSLVTSMRMLCTSSSCNQSGFLHPGCLRRVEDLIIRHISGSKFRTGNIGLFRQELKHYDWKSDRDRMALWGEAKNSAIGVRSGLYPLVAKLVRCCCGKGFLRRDLEWPPSSLKRAHRKPPVKSKETSLPALNVQRQSKGNNNIKHDISSKTTATASLYALPKVMKEEKPDRAAIPGAVWVPEGRKRGEVTKWEGGSEGWGHIRWVGNQQRKF